jgi:hypothetical protein
MFKFPVSFPDSFDNVPVVRDEQPMTLRFCFLINGNKYWLSTDRTLEINKQYQIAFTSKENSYKLYVGEETENISLEANLYSSIIPESVFNSNFQLGHYLHNNQAQGIYDEFYVRKSQTSQATIDLWHALATPLIDLNETITVDVSKSPIIAGAGAVVIDNRGVFGFNNGVIRSGIGTDGKFVCGGGAVKGDETGLRTYSYDGIEQVSIGTDGKLIAGAGTFIADRSGVTINNGKLAIYNTEGNVIIDGTGTVLKVHTSGIIPVANGSSLNVPFAYLGYHPAFLAYCETSVGIIPPYTRLVPNGSNNFIEQIWFANINSMTTLNITNVSGQNIRVKYYILREEAL